MMINYLLLRLNYLFQRSTFLLSLLLLPNKVMQVSIFKNLMCINTYKTFAINADL